MIHTAVFQLVGSYAGGIYSFCNKGIDIGKFFISDININASKHIDCVYNGFPVKGCVVVNLKVKIVFQRLYSLFRATQEISLIDFIKVFFLINAQIGITENRKQANFSGFPVDAAKHFYIR